MSNITHKLWHISLWWRAALSVLSTPWLAINWSLLYYFKNTESSHETTTIFYAITFSRSRETIFSQVPLQHCIFCQVALISSPVPTEALAWRETFCESTLEFFSDITRGNCRGKFPESLNTTKTYTKRIRFFETFTKLLCVMKTSFQLLGMINWQYFSFFWVKKN